MRPQASGSEPPITSEGEKNSPDRGGSHNEEDYSVFSAAMRTYLTYLLGFIIILSTLTATIYFPLIPMLTKHFSVSIQAINLTVTVYAICPAISPALFASLADASGRRPVLMGLVSLYACASLGLALNRDSYAALVALRALQSIGGSATPPIAYGIVADAALVSERGKMLGPMLSTCNAISAVGPVIGGAVALSTSGHTWVFLVLLILAVICLLLAGFTLPETARTVVGNGTQPAHGIWRTWWSFFRGKEQQWRNESEATDGTERPLQVDGKLTWRHLSAFASLRIIFYPDAAAVLWMVASSYSVYYTFQVAIPVIFEEIYGYSELEIGLTFLPGLAGMTIGGIIAGKLVDRNYAKTARKYNADVDRDKGDSLKDFPIESAGYRKCLPFLLFVVALVAGYGWAVQSHIHPSVPLIMQFFICAMSTLLSHTSSALLVDIFPDTSSTAYASGQIMRCGLSAALAAILQPLVDAVGRGWYFTIFALFVGISGLVSVVISQSKGMQWRQKRQAAPCCEGPDRTASTATAGRTKT
jgi:MFS family permease